jgi:hypothetical protein
MAEGGVDVQAGGGTNDIIILVIALLGLSVIVGGILFAIRDKPKEKKKKEKDEGEEEVFVQKGRVKGAARKRGLAGMKKKKAKAESDSDGSGSEEEETPDDMLTKKDLMKREKKRERAEYKAFMDDQKEEKDKRLNAKESAYRAKEEAREAEELEREELAKKEEEERKQKEQEEFEKWKEMFSVEDEGAANEGNANEYQGLLGLFIDYIKKNKVVVLEELASEFGLSATEAVERVQLLEEMKRISGVVDDRGKCKFFVLLRNAHGLYFQERKRDLSVFVHSFRLPRSLFSCSHLCHRRGDEKDGQICLGEGPLEHQ